MRAERRPRCTSSPRPHTSRLQRLTGAVDEAHAEAEDVAREAAEALKGTASVVGLSVPSSYLPPPRLLGNVPSPMGPGHYPTADWIGLPRCCRS